MPKAAPIITGFNSGEFTPLLDGRVDLKYYPHACRKLRNFELTVQGPARRRPGTRYVAGVKNHAHRCWLWRFEFNVEQAYVLLFGDQYVRFFSNHGVVESAPGVPLEVATPYTVSDLTRSDGTFALRFVQSGDVLYIVHPNFKPRKLTRTGAAAFSIAEADFIGGPFQDIDPDETITVYASANTGVGITLTASSAIFTASHVGALFYMEQKKTDAIKQWEAGKVITLPAVRRSDGKNYTALNAATTGTIKPTHSYGAKYDGDTGVQWQFDDPGYGWCKITAIGGGGTTATVTVLSRIPDGAVGAGNPTTRWAFGAWSDVEGWPDNITFYKERLCLSRDRQVWMSVAGDFENFQRRDDGGMITTDMAIVADITSDRANQIEWLAPSDTALLVGTAGDEHALNEISPSEPFGPGNAKARKQTEHGSRHVPVLRVGNGVIFTQRAGRKVRDMLLAESVNERWVAGDTTVLAEHVTQSGIIDATYQQEPNSTAWLIRADGDMVGFTIDRDQDVKGWHPHQLGGHADKNTNEPAVVESVISINSPDADRDELWLIVRRSVNGSTVRYVEWKEKHFDRGDDQEDAFYVDCGLTLNNVKNATLTPGTGATVKGTTNVIFTAGSAIFNAGDVGKYIHYRYYTYDYKGDIEWHKSIALITEYTDTTHVKGTIDLPWPSLSIIAANGWRMTVTTISGLDHLEGETVTVCVDGASHPNAVVSSGSITLNTPSSKVHIGLPYVSVLQPMPIEAGAADGTAKGKTKRAHRVGIGFYETIGAKYGSDEQNELDEIDPRDPSMLMDNAPAPFTGMQIVSWPDGYTDDLLLTIIQEQPLPCTVTCLAVFMKTEDAK